jgi:hypothetical protein
LKVSQNLRARRQRRLGGLAQRRDTCGVRNGRKVRCGRPGLGVSSAGVSWDEEAFHRRDAEALRKARRRRWNGKAKPESAESAEIWWAGAAEETTRGLRVGRKVRCGRPGLGVSSAGVSWDGEAFHRRGAEALRKARRRRGNGKAKPESAEEAETWWAGAAKRQLWVESW